MEPAMLLVGFVVLVTHAIEAVTGFGCTVLAFPFAQWFIGIDRAKLVLAILAWMLALYIVATNPRKINWRQAVIIIGLAALGFPIGAFAYQHLSKEVLVKLLGGFIVISSCLQIFKRRMSERPLPRPLGWLLLFCGGIVHGAFATGGPLVVLYAARALPDKGEFRATLCLLWATLNSLMMVQFYEAGQLNAASGRDLALLVPFLVAGIVIGEIAHRRIRPELFSRVVFSVLLATGVFMVTF